MRPGLGRLVEFDSRSRDYPIRTLLARRVPASTTWHCGPYLDQGLSSACVGFSWAHELAAVPVEVPVDARRAFALYHRAQQLDEWPGENYEGTSVLAGAKATQETGHVVEYRWAFGIDDMLQSISDIGPVVIGVNWYNSMFDVNAYGFLDVAGRLAGGHAILVRGVNVEEQYVLLHNSWGASWGDRGTAKLAFGDLDRLLKEDGECCVPLIRVLEPANPIQPDGCWPKSLRRFVADS